MTDWLSTTSTGDGRLAAIRVDTDGHVVFEDAGRGQRKRLDPSSAMRSILEAPFGKGPVRSQDLISDWIENGWRPSLEYLLWSERPGPGTPRPVTVTATPRDWHKLPRPTSGFPELTVGELVIRRRTVRIFDPRPIAGAELASVIALPGIALGAGVALRLVAYNVDGLVPGVWTVDQERRAVSLDASGDFRDRMCLLMCGMPAAKTASLTIVMVVDMLQRQHAHPYERALRELYVDLGRISQHLIIAAESVGLGCLITPATNDRELTALLRLAPSECPVYTLTIGQKPSRDS